MEESIDLLELWRAIQKRWLIVVAVPLVALFTSGILSFFVLRPVYQSTALVIVGKRTEAQADKTVEYNSVMANQQLAKTYETIAKSRTVLERVANQIGGNLTPEDLSKQVSVEAVKNTEVIAVKVNDESPELAAKIANSLTAEFATRVKEVKKVDSVGVIDSAVPPLDPIQPNKKLNLVLALVLGLFASVGLVLVLEFLDNTVKTADEAEELTGLTILGSIPQFSSGK